mgnify:CR=1 FL=1
MSAEVIHKKSLPLKHKRAHISDFAHKATHQTGGADELNVSGLSGSITDSVYPATLSGKTRIIKIKDDVGGLWYISGAAYDTYSVPTSPNPLNALTWTMGGASITTYSGYLSSGAAQNFVDFTSGQSLTNQIFRVTSSLTGSTSNTTRFSQADSGSLNANINGVITSSFYLQAAFNEANRETYQSWAPSSSSPANITVKGVAMYNSYPPYQTGSASINVLTTNILDGENKIQLIHTGAAGVAIGSGSYHFFNDTSSAIGMNTPTVEESATSSNVWLSGVQYYGVNDIFIFQFTGSRLFETTFRSVPAVVTSTAFGITTYNVNYSDSKETWNVAVPASVPPITGSFTYSGAKTVANASVLRGAASISVTVSDPIGNSATVASSTATKWLVNTYATTSTAKAESFVDENRRLYSGAYDTIPNVSAIWTSSNALETYDSIVTGALVYPSGSVFNFTTGYNPVGTANYDHTEDQLYFRAMSGSTPLTAGTVTITGLALSDFQGDNSPTYINAKVEIKLPSQTGWLDLGKAFNPGTFAGADGDGCWTSGTTNTFGWSSGTFSTANSGYMYILKITLKSGSNYAYNNKRITSLSEASL